MNDSHPMPAGVAGEPHAVDGSERAVTATQDTSWMEAVPDSLVDDIYSELGQLLRIDGNDDQANDYLTDIVTTILPLVGRALEDALNGSHPRAAVTRDQHIRAAALEAAATWLAGIDPFPQGVPFVLDVAGRFEGWIRGGSHRCDSTGSGAECPCTASNSGFRCDGTLETAQGLEEAET